MVHHLSAVTKRTARRFGRLRPVPARDAGNLRLRGGQATSENKLAPFDLPRHLFGGARIVEIHAVKEQDLVTAAAQLPHHGFEIAKEVHVLRDYQDSHDASGTAR